MANNGFIGTPTQHGAMIPASASQGNGRNDSLAFTSHSQSRGGFFGGAASPIPNGNFGAGLYGSPMLSPAMAMPSNRPVALMGTQLLYDLGWNIHRPSFAIRPESLLLHGAPMGTVYFDFVTKQQRREAFMEQMMIGGENSVRELAAVEDGVVNFRDDIGLYKQKLGEAQQALQQAIDAVSRLETATLPKVEKFALEARSRLYGFGQTGPSEYDDVVVDVLLKDFRGTTNRFNKESMESLSDKLCLRSWDDIQALPDEECYAVLVGLSKRGLHLNRYCCDAVREYQESGVLAEPFDMSQGIYCNKTYTTETLRGLLSIYLGKVELGFSGFIRRRHSQNLPVWGNISQQQQQQQQPVQAQGGFAVNMTTRGGDKRRRI